MSDELDARIAAAVLADERARKVDAVRRLIDEETAVLSIQLDTQEAAIAMARSEAMDFLHGKDRAGGLDGRFSGPLGLVRACIRKGRSAEREVEAWRVRAVTAEQDAATLMDTLAKRSAALDRTVAGKLGDAPTSALWAELAKRGEPCPDEDCPSNYHVDNEVCAALYREATPRPERCKSCANGGFDSQCPECGCCSDKWDDNCGCTSSTCGCVEARNEREDER